MSSKYATVLDREIHYMEWGRQNEDVVLMWHGLFRTGRDFDDIAAHLRDRYRVICPDVIGRGQSEWSPLPEEEYTIAYYAKMAACFVEHLGLQRVRWLGTSMGGLIGIQVASDVLRDKITHLIVNDVGPKLNQAAIDNIRDYGNKAPRFRRMSEFEHYLRTIYATWGELTDEQWCHIAETSKRRTGDGSLTTHYDPAIVDQLARPDFALDMWEQYDKIRAKTLCLHGENSELLLPEVVAEMGFRGPRCRVATIKGVGHAPALADGEQFAIVRRFFES